MYLAGELVQIVADTPQLPGDLFRAGDDNDLFVQRTVPQVHAGFAVGRERFFNDFFLFFRRNAEGNDAGSGRFFHGKSPFLNEISRCAGAAVKYRFFAKAM